MAYNDEAVKAKLSTLNETQESIVTVAQWIMFHRRHADRTATLWLERVKDSNAGKRLNLIYLANEVVQQSKARKRNDFLVAFSPFVPEAAATAFRGASTDIRGKIKRVVEVWRQRAIFEDTIQSAVEARIKEIETTQSTGGKKLLGGSLFSGNAGPGPSAPAELKALVALQETATKAEMTTGQLLGQAENDAKEFDEPSRMAIPVRIARYNKTLKSLSQAETAVSAAIMARQGLLAELERLLKSNREALAAAETKRSSLHVQATEISEAKQQDEDSIMRRLPPNDEDQSSAHPNGRSLVKLDADASDEAKREELTPPPVEDFTPVGTPETKAVRDDDLQQSSVIDGGLWNDTNANDGGMAWNTPEPGADLLASLSRPFSTTDMAGDDSTSKRLRKSETAIPSNNNSIPGLSDDVDALIRSEGQQG